MTIAYLGLGSNLNNPVQQVSRAVSSLKNTDGIIVCKVSRFYRSSPLGPQNQPDFINAVAEIESALSPTELLFALQALERAQGRVRSRQRWGPRQIDLDILLFGSEVILRSDLQIPHPGLSKREFMVYPLAEIAPDLKLPSGVMIADIRKQCPLRLMTILKEFDYAGDLSRNL